MLYIAPISLLGIYFVLSTKILESKNQHPSALSTDDQRRRLNSPVCVLRQCTLEQKEKHGSLFASFDPTWSGCYGDFYLMAFDQIDASHYTLLDVGANKAYAVATWLAFFAPELNINQGALHGYLQSTRKLTYECGSCDDCKDMPFQRKNAHQNVTLNIHAFEPQPDTVLVLKGMQAWMNLSNRTKSTVSIHGMAVSK